MNKSKTDKIKDVLIIGGGPGAMCAAIYAARMKLSVILVTENFGGHVIETDKIENYLGFKSVTGIELNKQFEEHLNSYDIKILDDSRVKKVYQKGKIVFSELENGKRLKSKTSIIATGSERKKLGIKGEKEFVNKGVTYCSVCDGPIFKDKTVAIIGGGYSGTKSALYLSKIAKKVYLFELKDRLKSEEVLLDEIKKTKKIKVITNAKIKEIYGNNFVKGLKYINLKNKKEEEIAVEGISIEIGTLPNSSICNLKKTKKGYIKVDKNMVTSSDRIFAVGDVNDNGPEQIIVSASQGCIAALRISEILKIK